MNQGVIAIVAWVFNRLVKQEQLAGYRMYLGGASSILGGIVLVLDMVVGGEFNTEKAGMAWAAIAFGYTVIGHAGKQDVIKSALTSPSEPAKLPGT